MWDSQDRAWRERVGLEQRAVSASGLARSPSAQSHRYTARRLQQTRSPSSMWPTPARLQFETSPHCSVLVRSERLTAEDLPFAGIKNSHIFASKRRGPPFPYAEDLPPPPDSPSRPDSPMLSEAPIGSSRSARRAWQEMAAREVDQATSAPGPPAVASAETTPLAEQVREALREAEVSRLATNTRQVSHEYFTPHKPGRRLLSAPAQRPQTSTSRRSVSTATLARSGACGGARGGVQGGTVGMRRPTSHSMGRGCHYPGARLVSYYANEEWKTSPTSARDEQRRARPTHGRTLSYLDASSWRAAQLIYS